tara:strand:+ start:1009 stop:1191 length:183 start_codon:yes stop_codon:yes gene_type:complete
VEEYLSGRTEVAERLEISLRHYQRLETGQDTTVTLLSKLAQVFPEADFSEIIHSPKLKSA